MNEAPAPGVTPHGSMLSPALLALLVCPACGGEFAPGDARIVCRACGLEVAAPGGVPRFVPAGLDETSERTRRSFGYEWTHFADWTASGDTNFQDYFGDLELARLSQALVLDAGCGMGRHARMLGPHVGQLVALDFSDAIDQAAQALAVLPHAGCLQADLANPPLRDASFDFVYSLGVLHHLEDTSGALARLARLTRPGGRLRVYLYWQPEGWRGRVLSLVNALRPITTRLPFGVLKAWCFCLSVGLWLGLIVPYRALAALGATWVTRLPLFQYVKYPFVILYNDQFDRFSAPLEKRYRAEQVRALLAAAGLIDIRVWPRYGWIAEGRRPSAPA